MRRRQQPFSRHAGFFASLQRVEHRLASESEQQHQEQNKSPSPAAATATATATAAAGQSEASPFTDTMTTASPLLFLDPAAAPAPAPSSGTAADRDSSGPALDFLTAATEEEQRIQQDDDGDDEDNEGGEEDIARLVALLGLSPPPGAGDSSSHDDGGCECDCSGADGFLAKVVGVVGPKCDREKARLDAWIRHYHRSGDGGGGCREPARLAHLLLARASADTAAVAFPASVKDFLDHHPPRQLTDTSE